MKYKIDPPLIIIGGVLLAMVIFLCFSLFTHRNPGNKEFTELLTRLQLLETKIESLTLSGPETATDTIGDKYLCTRLEGTLELKTRLLNEKISSLQDEIESLNNRIAKRDRVSSKKVPETKTVDTPKKIIEKKVAEIVKKPVEAVVKKKYVHIIKKGETYFSISKKYGVSVLELMEMNNKKEGSVIYPGQKLWISNK
jgi:LysM repeat protein